MIPRLSAFEAPTALTQSFLTALAKGGFCGELCSETSERLIAGTDNSVYQLFPQAVVYPAQVEDLELLTKLLGKPEFRSLKVAPRGGGTGTNGQSLTQGLVIDLSRHLNQILEINTQEGWVRVQPGVVLDRLNDLLSPLGYFFAPTLSTSSRATLGGMISTDACGKGSRIYGKTSDHILALKCRMVGGQRLKTEILDEAGWKGERLGEHGDLYALIDQILSERTEEIAQLPQLDRFVTGYNLTRLKDPQSGQYSLNYLIAGSEGTLALVEEAKLKILPLVKHKQLLALRYPDFLAALRGAEALVSLDPAAIETIDDTILGLAREDEIFHLVGPMLSAEGEPVPQAINLVEFIGETAEELQQKIDQAEGLIKQSQGQPGQPSGYYKAAKAHEIAALWELRKKGVGLLGNAKGNRRPIAFVEDTVVPPKHLAAYIEEFRALLEKHGLFYGMFGHVDVGCLHVRPALDMRLPEDQKLLKRISDEVADLVGKYGGVIWGEHGKGFRSGYTEKYVGPVLYQEMGRIKAYFDRNNQLNPGKIVLPCGCEESLVSVDGPMRGDQDRQISAAYQEEFDRAIACNGNGACFNFSPASVMCPSSKSSLNRLHSPKGRAGLMREWLRRLSIAGYQPGGRESMLFGPALRWVGGLEKSLGCYDFSHEVAEAMEGCLACKACVTGCPIKVDIPEMKARFQAEYHRRYPRPVTHLLAAALEWTAPIQAATPRLSRALMSNRLLRSLIAKWGGIVDPPKISQRPVNRRLALGELRLLNIAQPPADLDPRRDVVLIQDSFTSFYEAKTVGHLHELCELLGYRLWLLPHFPNGKALQVKGMLEAFAKVAERNHRLLERASYLGLPMIGLDPAVTLTYRDEYPKALGLKHAGYQVWLPQEWLAGVVDQQAARLSALAPAEFSARLFGHCTEKALEPQSQKLWQSVFKAFGISLKLEEVGCCGMSGIYGHEAKHYSQSRQIFDLSWRPKLEGDPDPGLRLLATGYSCRSQAKRLMGQRPAHPLVVLLERLGEGRHD
ncbi:MAG: FAD-binding and (Fe-S)-binding domain-containing protein [bacterium]|nr:FAD-binding and (Fe-S)-binding domain-containing protein [bacterium]